MNARKSEPTPTDPQQERNRQSVLRQLAALQDLTTDQIKDRWRDLCGSEPPAYNRQYLVRRLAYRIQELYYGGISQTTRERLRRTAQNDPQACFTKPEAKSGKEGGITDGMRFVRHWQGQRYEVVVAQGGFEFEGQRFRSLTAITKKITGAHWNGRSFFGVKSKPRNTTQGKDRS